MYIISITVNGDVSEQQQNTLFPLHMTWLQKHFASGTFLLLGPYTDTEAHAGVILARADSREILQSILEEDCYYPDLAQYEVREFMPKMAPAGWTA